MFKRIAIITLSMFTVFVASNIPNVAFAAERYEILQVGDDDSFVLELQTALNKLGYLQFPATGYFGTDTQNAVIKFQQEKGLGVDGKAGPGTRKSLLGDDYQPILEREVKDISDSESAVFEGTINEPIAETPDTPPTEEIKKVPVESLIILPIPAPPTTATAAADIDSLKSGDKGDEVAKMQSRLAELEYYEYGNNTGYFGPVTEEAVKKFQRTNGIEVNGIMSKSALDLLYSENANYYMMFAGDSGDDIKAMQERLSVLGYFTGNATGYYGDATLQAVKMFQSNNNLIVDGKAGKSTRKILFSDTAVKAPNAPAPSASPKPSATPKPEATQKPNAEATPSPTPPPANNGGDTQAPPPAATPEPPAPAPEPTPEPPAPPAVSPGTGIDKFIEIAQSLTGVPYVYGTSGPNSFDCSGFVYYCLKNSGVATGRLSSAGYANVSNWASVSDVNSLVYGDLVFFKSDSSSVISHMGIYLGGGSFIHAAPSIGGVSTSSMSSGYYARNYVSAKRVF